MNCSIMHFKTSRHDLTVCVAHQDTTTPSVEGAVPLIYIAESGAWIPLACDCHRTKLALCLDYIGSCCRTLGNLPSRKRPRKSSER